MWRIRTATLSALAAVRQKTNYHQMPPVEVIINVAGGSFVEGETDMAAMSGFHEQGLEINLHLAKVGSEVTSLADEAAKSQADVIVAGGGDGTVNAVAAEARKSEKILGILPLGTLNHFSKDLGIPQN